MATGKQFANAFPDRTFQSPLVELLMKSGRNGNIKRHCSYEFFSLLSVLCALMHVYHLCKDFSHLSVLYAFACLLF